MIDVNRLAGAVTREVSSREVDGRVERVVVATRSYATGPEDLWDAITNPQRLPRWFLPVSGDLRLGGRYQLEGNAGGEIVECEPPRRLAVTWALPGQEPVGRVIVTLDPDGDGDRDSTAAGDSTILRLEHVGVVPDEFWDEYGPGAVGVGWDGALMGLELHLSSDDSVRPDNYNEWAVGPEGRDFAARTSAAWGKAAIAAGQDERSAHAAAKRTEAFYTGEPRPADPA